MIRGLRFTTKGSERSGHHGHAGRPGSVGGSAPGGGHHTAAGSSALGRMASSSPISSTTPLGEDQIGVNGSYLIEREDGSKGIFKPTSEMEAGDPDAEVLAYELSESLGWNFIPHTEMIVHEGKEGSVQKWIEDSETFREAVGWRKRDLYKEAGERVEVFDLLTGNEDRHPGNMIRDKSGNDWAIDNGFCFGAYEPGQNVPYELRSMNAPPGLRSIPSYLRGSTVLAELASWAKSPKSAIFVNHLRSTYKPRVAEDFIYNLALLTSQVK